jgi:hypothetical protein
MVVSSVAFLHYPFTNNPQASRLLIGRQTQQPLPMYKPSAYLVVTYFYTYVYMRPISNRIDNQGETKY